MARLIWLSSYRKSGNTWVRLFLSRLHRPEGIDLTRMQATGFMAAGRAVLEEYLSISLADLPPDMVTNLRPAAYRTLAATPNQSSLVFKVHEQFGRTPDGQWLFPPEATAGCVHIVRDPRDVCLSLSAHENVTVDKAISILADRARTISRRGPRGMTQVSQFEGSWSDHARSWLESGLPRLTVRYEDMLADPEAVQARIAAFCGIDATPDTIRMAVEETRFERLRDQEAASGFRERPKGMDRFFREGRAGQWREALSAEQIRRIERDHGEVMRQLGYAITL